MKKIKPITHQFFIKRMHCKGCGELVQKEIGDLSYVFSVEVDIHRNVISVEGDFEGVPPEELAKDFTHILAEHKFEVRYIGEKDNVKETL